MKQGPLENLTWAFVNYVSLRKLLILRSITILIILVAVPSCSPKPIISPSPQPSPSPQSASWNFELLNHSQEVKPGSTVIYDVAITNNTNRNLVIESVTWKIDSNLYSPPSLLSTNRSAQFRVVFADNYLKTKGIIPTTGFKGEFLVMELDMSARVGTGGILTLTISPDLLDPISQETKFRVIAP